jgi:hypothetical protein
MRNTRTHGLDDDPHRQTLQLRQNVAPEIHAIERSVIPPRSNSFALL